MPPNITPDGVPIISELGTPYFSDDCCCEKTGGEDCLPATHLQVLVPGFSRHDLCTSEPFVALLPIVIESTASEFLASAQLNEGEFASGCCPQPGQFTACNWSFSLSWKPINGDFGNTNQKWILSGSGVFESTIIRVNVTEPWRLVWTSEPNPEDGTCKASTNRELVGNVCKWDAVIGEPVVAGPSYVKVAGFCLPFGGWDTADDMVLTLLRIPLGGGADRR